MKKLVLASLFVCASSLFISAPAAAHDFSGAFAHPQTTTPSTIPPPPPAPSLDPTSIVAAFGASTAWTGWAQTSLQTLGANQASDESAMHGTGGYDAQLLALNNANSTSIGLIGALRSDLTATQNVVNDPTQGNAALLAAIQTLQQQVKALQGTTVTPTVIHFEAEKMQTSSPPCMNATVPPATAPCIQNTSDVAPPAVGSLKVVLTAGMTLCYNFTPPAGSYVLTARLNGVSSLHFEDPQGVNVSGSIVNAAGSLGTFTAPSTLTLVGAAQTGCWVVDSVGSGVPSMNWFELTKQ